MSAIILDGKALAADLKLKLKSRVSELKVIPKLAIILVGEDPASHTYVRLKMKACEAVGVQCELFKKESSMQTEELTSLIQTLNQDPSVHGILLQHPVSKHIDERLCFDTISSKKDVDGVTCLGYGRMTMGEKAFGSATPIAIMKLLAHYQISVEGLHAVVVGRSPILGKPLASMLLNQNATVTICHSRTQNLPELIRTADLVVGALGKKRFIKSEWIKDHAVVVDAGYHPDDKCGDIDLEGLEGRVKALTPVPGGVGPMTIMSLITQTVEAAEEISS